LEAAKGQPKWSFEETVLTYLHDFQDMFEKKDFLLPDPGTMSLSYYWV
jgi:hypothetical protein